MEQTKVRALFADQDTRELKVVEVDGWRDYVKLIECEYFDIVTRAIGGRGFSFFVDDLGLYKECNKPIATSADLQEQLVGNVIVAGLADDEGNTTSLTDEDIEILKRNFSKHHIFIYDFTL